MRTKNTVGIGVLMIVGGKFENVLIILPNAQANNHPDRAMLFEYRVPCYPMFGTSYQCGDFFQACVGFGHENANKDY